MLAIVILLLHFYFYSYDAFRIWKLTTGVTDRILQIITRTGLFDHFLNSKGTALGLLVISLFGAKGRKSLSLTYRVALIYLGSGLLLYFGGAIFFYCIDDPQLLACTYMTFTGSGFILILTGCNYLSRILHHRTKNDIFNRTNESFPQEEKLIDNFFSVNFRAKYDYQGHVKDSWINVPNPFRGCLLVGNPGSSKTISFVEQVIKQQIKKKYSMLVYDFKYDDLSRIAYNYFVRYSETYPGKPAFYNINFDDLSRSHRCNPLHPSTLERMSDAGEASRTILLGLNMDWISKQGDFWVESPINFVAALIWFLKKYQNGKYCTWAHVIELAQAPYKKLFSILRTEPQIGALISPFVEALLQGATDQLSGQIASATISLARLSSPELYYVLTGNDFTLDINDPAAPKILCLGNNPQRSSVYGPILSVYINTINRLANRKGGYPFSEVLDEAASITVTSLDKTLAYGRSNLIAVFLVIQDLTQLRLAYGHKYADVLFNLCGNIFCGQTSGDTARQISERIGKTVQTRESISINASDTNITLSDHLEMAVPISRIASLSAGEFVGMVADSPNQPIELKAFCSKIVIDHNNLEKEKRQYKELPKVTDVTEQLLLDNFLQVKQDIELMIRSELGRMSNSEELVDLLIE
jgi:hypothetical protein